VNAENQIAQARHGGLELPRGRRGVVGADVVLVDVDVEAELVRVDVGTGEEVEEEDGM
jgi:hypothetical protein